MENALIGTQLRLQFEYPATPGIAQLCAITPEPIKNTEINMVEPEVVAQIQADAKSAEEPAPEKIKFNKGLRDSIKQIIKFSAEKQYFTGRSSNDLNEVVREIKKAYQLSFNGDLDEFWEYFSVKTFSIASIATDLAKQMSYNPVRWETAVEFLKEPSNLTGNFVQFPRVFQEVSFEKEYSCESICSMLQRYMNDYSKSVFDFEGKPGKSFTIKYEYSQTRDKYVLCSTYWAVRHMFDMFKCVCQQNLRDFNKSKEHREAIARTVMQRHNLKVR